MKDKAIFIISLVLVVVGVGYLGYTAYRFFTRDAGNTTVENPFTTNNNEVTQNTDALVLNGSSNKELISNNTRQGDTVEISAEVRNSSSNRISANFEGRVYSIEELYTFPDVETEIPVNTKTVPVSVNADSVNTFNYNYTVDKCGNFYIALGSDEYWNTGRGVVSYGYFTVSCDNSFVSNTTPSSKPSVSVSPKGGVTDVPSVSPTPEQVGQLPKAGPAEDAMLIGFVLVLLGVLYRVKYIR